MSYTIALVATDNLEYISCAEAVLKNHFHGESIVGQTMLPHITIAEFDATEQQLQEIIIFLNNNIKVTPQPLPEKLVYHKHKEIDYIYWINIQIIRDKELQTLNNLLADLLEKLDITPLTPMKQQYNPHIKLASIIRPNNIHLKTLKPRGLDITSFVLKLGTTDDCGLFCETLEEFNIHPNFISKSTRLRL